MAARKVAVDPFPLVPATRTVGKASWGSSRADSRRRTWSSPRWIPKRARWSRARAASGVRGTVSGSGGSRSEAGALAGAFLFLRQLVGHPQPQAGGVVHLPRRFLAALQLRQAI